MLFAWFCVFSVTEVRCFTFFPRFSPGWSRKKWLRIKKNNASLNKNDSLCHTSLLILFWEIRGRLVLLYICRDIDIDFFMISTFAQQSIEIRFFFGSTFSIFRKHINIYKFNEFSLDLLTTIFQCTFRPANPDVQWSINTNYIFVINS